MKIAMKAKPTNHQEKKMPKKRSTISKKNIMKSKPKKHVTSSHSYSKIHETNPIGDQLLRASLAARYLGCCDLTLYLWRKQKEGPAYYKIGGRYYYKMSDLANFIESRRYSVDQCDEYARN